MGASDQKARAGHGELAVLLLVATGGLIAVARFNYLLFHGLVEGFAITVAMSVFVVAWSARRYLESGFLLLVGIAFFFIGLIELLHALAYPGMHVIGDERYPSSQLWLGARFLEAVTLLVAFAFVPIRRRLDRWVMMAVYAAATGALLASVFLWRSFPACFVEGAGQTPFKVWSEYVIVALFGLGLVLLRVERERFDARVRRAIAASMILAALAEVCFAHYASTQSAANLVGHLLHLYSHVAIYVALVESCLERPFEIVFRELNTVNSRLLAEIAVRREAEQAKDGAIAELRTALDEIDTLRGIIPICSHCKKIRDDAGAWSQMEAYIQRRSAAQFSHGICPDCLRRYYPEDSAAVLPER